MQALFKGLGVAVVTPFTDQNKVDEDALRSIINHLISNEVDYLVALGTTGEPATLSEKETHHILDIFFDEVSGMIPVIIGCGGNNTRKISKQIQAYSKQYKVGGFLSVSPYYNKPTQEGIFEHFSTIAEHTDEPIILYNVPGRTASNISPDTVIKLANTHPNIKAIKEASGDLLQVMELIQRKPPEFQILSGDDFTGFNIIALGGEGIISVVANAFPSEMAALVAYTSESHLSNARSIHYQLLPHMHLCFEEGNPAGIKAILAEKGLCKPNVRLPLLSASEKLIQNIKRQLAFTS